jgi:pyridoxine 5'-phosphate synthase PdxJ
MLTIEKKSLNVGKFVTTEHVDCVIRNYKQERWIQNSERLGKEDSLSAWWSIEELEKFLETAKTHSADGVKFYFGAYAKDYTEKPEYAGLQTLAMVATKQKEGAYGTTINKDVYINGENGNTILGYNLAALCPPFCGKKGALDDSEEIGISIIDRGDAGMMII